MRFAQVALVALIGMEGVYAGGKHGPAHKGHADGLVEHLVKPTYPKKTDTYANRARPLKPSTNKKGVSRRDLSPSLDGSCGEGKTCEGSPFGPCCSADGWCGSSIASCGSGCLELYGICNSARLAERQATDSASACDAPSSSGAAANVPAVQQPATTIQTSTTSAAAAANSPSTTSKPSTTSSAKPSSTSTKPASTTSAAALKVSTDGKCGATAKSTCTGSRYGTCCSKSNTCGSTNAYCLKTQGCQPLYGKCT